MWPWTGPLLLSVAHKVVTGVQCASCFTPFCQTAQCCLLNTSHVSPLAFRSGVGGMRQLQAPARHPAGSAACGRKSDQECVHRQGARSGSCAMGRRLLCRHSARCGCVRSGDCAGSLDGLCGCTEHAGQRSPAHCMCKSTVPNCFAAVAPAAIACA